MRAYRDGSNIYGLIRIHFNAQTDSSAPSPATPGHQGQAADSECSQAVAINRNIRFDPDSVLLVVDCHGYISTLSPSAATLFGYSKELLCGSSVRLLFPDLSDQDGPDICQTLTTLAE